MTPLMVPTFRIRISPRALSDLETIFDCIQQDSPQNAAKMIDRILHAIYSLEILPSRYAVPRSGAARDRNIRSMPVRPYLVRYRVDEQRKAVYILHVRHGARRDA